MKIDNVHALDSAGSIYNYRNLLSTQKVTSAVASVTFTPVGGYEIYMLELDKVVPATNDAYGTLRFTEAGTAVSSANYQNALHYHVSSSATVTSASSAANQTSIFLSNPTAGQGASSTATWGGLNSRIYIYGLNTTGDSLIKSETVWAWSAAQARVCQANGGSGLGLARPQDGVQFLFSSGNIASGSFRLYGVR